MSETYAPPRAGRFPVSTAWLLLAAVAVGAVVALVQPYFFGTEILLALAIGALSLAPLMVRAWQGRFDVFEPVTMVSFVYLLYFCVGPLFWMLTNDFGYLGSSYEMHYMRGLLAVSVPILATWVGYSLPVGKRLGHRLAPPVRLGEPGLRVLRRWGWGLTGAAVTGIVMWIVVSRQSLTRFLLPGVLTTAPQGGAEGPGMDIPYLFVAIDWFVPAFLLVLAGGGFRTRRSAWIYWMCVLVVYVSMAFRYRTLVFVIATAVLLYQRRGRRPGWGILTTGTTAVFLGAGWLSMLRTFFGSYGTQGSAEVSVTTAFQAALIDTRIFDTFATILYTYPRFKEHASLDPFLYVFILPIPRFMWPEKPDPYWLWDIGKVMGTPFSPTAGAAVPNFGEYYIALGWPGMIVGMVVFGILVRTLWAWLQADPRDPARQAIFAIAFIWILQVIIRGYLAQIVKEFAYLLLPFILAMLAARRAQRRADAAAA